MKGINAFFRRYIRRAPQPTSRSETGLRALVGGVPSSTAVLSCVDDGNKEQLPAPSRGLLSGHCLAWESTEEGLCAN